MHRPADEYAAARRTLLDALSALESHLDSVILVGAQAVYVHTGESDLTVPVFTTDADLALDTANLADTPEIAEALRHAGFVLDDNPGHWVSRQDVAVDLMVVPAQGGRAKRNARGASIPPHERNVARITRGLEPSLVDNRLVAISDSESSELRTVQIRVAGPAALLSAKAIKIQERFNQTSRQPDRLKPKDALDAFRILQAADVPELVKGFELHQHDEFAADVSNESLDFLSEHGSKQADLLPRLAAEAAGGHPTIPVAFAHLTTRLVEALGRS